MKITNVEALYLRLPAIERRSDSPQDALVVRISTDAGITGWGEVDSCPLVAKAVIEAPFSHTRTTGLRDLLIGEDPTDITRLWDLMYESTLYCGREGAVIHAMAGVDLALWDIKGKVLQQPVYQLLGGAHRDSIRVYASNMFEFTPEATADRARKAIDQGFTAVKFGSGTFRQKSGNGRQISFVDPQCNWQSRTIFSTLDVGLVWDAKTAIRRAKIFEPFKLIWIEEPLHPDDLRGYAR